MVGVNQEEKMAGTKSKISVNKSGSSTGNRENKKSNNLLSGIFTRLAPLAILASLKPIVDAIALTINLIAFLLLKLLKALDSDVAKTTTGTVSAIFDFGEWLGENLGEITWNFGEWLADMVILTFNFSEWLGEQIGEITFNFGEWLAEMLILLPFDFGLWLGERIANFVIGIFDFGEWLGEAIWNFFEGVFDFGEWLGETIWNFFEGVFNFGDWLWEGIWNFLEGKLNMGDWLWNSIGSFITGAFNIADWLWSHLSNFFTGGGGNSTNVGDAIIRPNGDVIKTDPNDTLFATTNPSGMGGGETHFNFYGLTMDEAIEKVRIELANDKTRATRF